MSPADRRKRQSEALILATRERNRDAVREMEATRDRLLARGALIVSPVWRANGPRALRPGS